jgi:hypothetical protein
MNVFSRLPDDIPDRRPIDHVEKPAFVEPEALSGKAGEPEDRAHDNARDQN